MVVQMMLLLLFVFSGGLFIRDENVPDWYAFCMLSRVTRGYLSAYLFVQLLSVKIKFCFNSMMSRKPPFDGTHHLEPAA